MSENSEVISALHAHLWGKPWTSGMGIFPLTRDHQTLLYQACEKIDKELLRNDEKFFNEIWKPMATYISTHTPVFFRLSCLSPKDVGVPLCAYSAEDVFTVTVQSFRVMCELEEYDPHSALILIPWDARIRAENEVRVLIVHGVCEGFIRTHDGTDLDEKQKFFIIEYVRERSSTFPAPTICLDVALYQDEVIFIEFNPFDDELDTFGIRNRENLSHPLRALLGDKLPEEERMNM